MDAQRLKVLAIDDNPDNLTTLRAVLGEALPGCVLLTALNGSEGIKLARAEDPDVILLDIVMPNMDGYAVCEKVKADPRLQTIPVIFLTALRTDRESRIKALEVGGEAFLSKPLDEQELIAQIRAMAKIKAANRLQKLEKEQLTKLVAERTQALNQELLERKWAEASRQDSYDAMKAILNTTLDGYWLTDSQGHLLDVNPAYCQLSGYTREELLGLRIPDIDFLENPDDTAERMLRIIRSHGSKFEARHRRKDGSIWDVEVSATFQDVAGGQFVAFLRDISARKAAEARVQRLTHLYLTLAQCNQAIVRAKDETQLFPEICRGAVLFGAMKMAWIGMADEAGQRVNPVASFGDDLHYLKDIQISLDEADPLGRGPTGTAMREGRPVWCQDFQNDPATAPWHERGARCGWRSSAVLPLRRKGGVVGALNFYSGIVNGFDEDARNLLTEMAADISHALDTFEDERERERIEAKFHESERRYHTLVEWSPEAMAVHSGGLLRYVNPAAVKLMGASSAQDLIGKSILDLVHPDSQAIMLARVKESLERGSEAPMIEEKFIKLDGSVIAVEVKSTPITFDGAPAIQVAVRDITERKRANEALRTSLREKEALLKEVHHRVKNNLQVITSLLNLEAGRSDHPATKAAFLEMQNRIRSMAMLHETLYRSENLERVDLPRYIRQLATQLFHSMLASPEAIQLHLDLAPASLALDQAVPCGLLINELVSNCLKHAFPEGRKGEVRIELQAMAADGRLKLRVSDNGVGLPPNFDQLRTTSLGLHLVSGLTEQLNGQLEITPGTGTGAVFQVTFAPKKISEG